MAMIKQNQLEAKFYQSLMQDHTVIPNLLLRHYTEIGLSDHDCLLFIFIIGAFPKQKQQVTFSQLKEIWAGEEQELHSILVDFTKRGFLTQIKQDTIEDTYSLDGFYHKLLELWVYLHACPQEESYNNLTKQITAQSINMKEQIKQVYRLFEGEFGRPLSPTEIETINKGLIEDHWNAVMIKEALKRAVLHGTDNLIYIDRILLRWQKEGIATLQQLSEESYPMKIAQTKQRENKKRRAAKILENETDYGDIYRY